MLIKDVIQILQGTEKGNYSAFDFFKLMQDQNNKSNRLLARTYLEPFTEEESNQRAYYFVLEEINISEKPKARCFLTNPACYDRDLADSISHDLLFWWASQNENAIIRDMTPHSEKYKK